MKLYYEWELKEEKRALDYGIYLRYELNPKSKDAEFDPNTIVIIHCHGTVDEGITFLVLRLYFEKNGYEASKAYISRIVQDIKCLVEEYTGYEIREKSVIPIELYQFEKTNVILNPYTLVDYTLV